MAVRSRLFFLLCSFSFKFIVTFEPFEEVFLCYSLGLKIFKSSLDIIPLTIGVFFKYSKVLLVVVVGAESILPTLMTDLLLLSSYDCGLPPFF